MMISRGKFYLLVAIVIAAVVGLIIWATSEAEEPEWDVSYPMTNTKITWEQAHHGDPWGAR